MSKGIVYIKIDNKDYYCIATTNDNSIVSPLFKDFDSCKNFIGYEGELVYDFGPFVINQIDMGNSLNAIDMLSSSKKFNWVLFNSLYEVMFLLSLLKGGFNDFISKSREDLIISSCEIDKNEFINLYYNNFFKIFESIKIKKDVQVKYLRALGQFCRIVFQHYEIDENTSFVDLFTKHLETYSSK